MVEIVEPVSKTQMLIRQPAPTVFEAFVDPDVTTRFWFTHSTGRLRKGDRVRWEWRMYGASADVQVLELEQDARILIEWSGAARPPNRVEWTFEPRSESMTLVSITESGFAGTLSEKVAQAINSTGGFTMVLAGLKALLEHELELNLIADHRPDSHVEDGGGSQGG